jgi:hypothetical protein
MATKLEICNLALQNVGANSIDSLNEGTPEANACVVRYDTTRKALLEMNPWNFATKRILLAATSVSPLYGFSKQYVLPADYIRLVSTKEEEVGGAVMSPISPTLLPDDYRIEIAQDGNRVLLSADDVKSIRYVFDQTDESKFSATFVELFARLLGANIAYRVTNSKSMKELELRIFKAELTTSLASDAAQTVEDFSQNSVWASDR